MKTSLLLLADEAIAQAALDAGITGAYAYPGTPSTEILEYIQRAPEAAERAVHRAWSVNEKTAMEEALGVAYAGRRALVCMKHVGLNVAADPFMNAAVTGVVGGLVVIAADDPSMHSSQNEQDSRFYAKFAGVPLLEPADQQEAYAMTRDAFDLSEAVGLPVVLRIPTRLAHSRAAVTPSPVRAPNPLRLPPDNRQFVLLPANARRNYEGLLDKQTVLLGRAEADGRNRMIDGPDRSVGIIACGLAINYLNEAYSPGSCPHPVLKLAQYPVPEAMIRALAVTTGSLLLLEEGYPMVEDMLRGILPNGVVIKGRRDGTLPRAGELSPENVAKAVGRPLSVTHAMPAVVKPRPPVMCPGCPHIDSYLFLKEVMAAHPAGRVFSDIGCYTLGALPPLEAISSCVDMGASITMAKGAADAGVRPSVAVIGDSTFTHSGLTGLLDCVFENAPVTILILDNGTTGMTGGQTSMATGRIEALVKGLGVAPEHLRTVTPLKKFHAENVAVLREEIAYEGVSVIIARRECIQITRKG
jgi:indolepyruvate ferredoxin oxidoreductase alpha subunit